VSKVLVAYATRYGSTAGVAEAIGDALHEAGGAADVRRAREVRDLTGYRAVITGGPIYASFWHGDAKRFVKRNRQALADLPVAYFAVGLSFAALTESARDAGRKAIEPASDLIAPVDYGYFAGATKQLPTFFAKAMSDSGKNDDLRDWAAIAAWAQDLLPRLGI